MTLMGKRVRKVGQKTQAETQAKLVADCLGYIIMAQITHLWKQKIWFWEQCDPGGIKTETPPTLRDNRLDLG